MNLVKGFTDGDAAFFELDLYNRQAINQNSHIIAVLARACLFKLMDDL